MKQNLKISLIIPCNHSTRELLELLGSVSKGRRLPDEILIIRSGRHASRNHSGSANPQFSCLTIDHPFTRFPQVGVYSCDLDLVFPGEARNIGVSQSSGDLIAFLDIKTIPTTRWLDHAYETLCTTEVDGVWGLRKYHGQTYLGGLIRDVIYGCIPTISVAGSVIRKEVFTRTGNMISWAPAGEDGDWIHRVRAHRLSFFTPKEATHDYHGLDGKALSFFVRKWWTYYHFSRLLPVNDRDRWLAQGFAYLVVIFFAFNWNYKISTFLLGDPLVVPHITTAVVIAGPTLYCLLRGIYRPLRRRVPIHRVLPIRFVSLLFVAVILDFVKIIALLTPTFVVFNRKLGINSSKGTAP